MADCLKCAKCREVSDGAWAQCGDEGRQGEQIPWSRARQSPCDDFEPKPVAVDCRRCVHCSDLVEGEGAICAFPAPGIELAWSEVTDGTCSLFESGPRRAPASPPVSADREGAEFLAKMAKALKAGRDALGMHGPCRNNSCSDCSRAHKLMREALAAISSEEARRARPAVEDQNAAKWAHVWRCSGCGEMRPARDATGPRWTWACGAWEHQCDASHREPARDFGPAVEDPRDALLRQCATDFARVRDYAPVLDRTPVDNSGCGDCARARERAWPPSLLCETHYSKAAQQERANERLLATQDHPMREIAREALEALRAAGVEPKP